MECDPSLTWSDARHVVVLAEVGEVLIELFDSLLVRLDAFAFQSLIELRGFVSMRRG